jgi:hypothetical protein
MHLIKWSNFLFFVPSPVPSSHHLSDITKKSLFGPKLREIVRCPPILFVLLVLAVAVAVMDRAPLPGSPSVLSSLSSPFRSLANLLNRTPTSASTSKSSPRTRIKVRLHLSPLPLLPPLVRCRPRPRFSWFGKTLCPG